MKHKLILGIGVLLLIAGVLGFLFASVGLATADRVARLKRGLASV